MREFNWASTSLGSPNSWPQSLRTTLSIILHSKFPMFLWWGPELLCFYNDAYRPSLGNNGKHPNALGKPGETVWPEIWPEIKPMIDQVLSGGESTLSQDQLIPIFRNSKIEDVYWTFSYSAVIDETEKPAGVFVTCTETTSNVVNIQESQEQLSFAIEAAELGTFNLNFDTNNFIFNQRLKDWFGQNHQDNEVELVPALNAIAEKDRERVSEAIKNALQPSSDGHYDIEYSIINHIDNQERIVRAKGRSLFNNDGTPYRFNGTIQDVTNEYLAKKDLEESTARLKSFIEEAPVATFVLEGSNLIVEIANEGMLNMIGKERTILGKPFIEAIPELGGQGFIELLQNVYATGMKYEAKSAKADLIKDGLLTIGYFDFTYKPVRGRNGDVWAIMCMAVDVTEMVISRQILAESEARFRTMAEGTEILIATIDKTGNSTYYNKAWSDFTGRSIDELLKKGWYDLINNLDSERFLNVSISAYQNRQPFREEFRILANSGKYRWLFLIGTPRFLPDNTFAGYISSSFDITNLKRAENSLLSQNKQLTHVNNELDTFIYTASHDLKAPISNLEGLLNAYIADKRFDKDENALIEMMFLSIERFKTTIKDLTDISKIQLSEEEDITKLSFSTSIDEVELDIKFLIEKLDPIIEKDLKVVEINYSRKNLRSIIYNLLSNALKYSSPERRPVIKISTQYENEFIVMKFSDNGLGLSNENQKKIFGMFKRAHQHVEGSGIGLYMIKKIIENSDGKIELESDLGIGTIFKVYFKI